MLFNFSDLPKKILAFKSIGPRMRSVSVYSSYWTCQFYFLHACQLPHLVHCHCWYRTLPHWFKLSWVTWSSMLVLLQFECSLFSLFKWTLPMKRCEWSINLKPTLLHQLFIHTFSWLVLLLQYRYLVVPMTKRSLALLACAYCPVGVTHLLSVHLTWPTCSAYYLPHFLHPGCSIVSPTISASVFTVR